MTPERERARLIEAICAGVLASQSCPHPDLFIEMKDKLKTTSVDGLRRIYGGALTELKPLRLPA